MEFFDANCTYGPLPSPPPRYSLTAEELLAEMDFCGVQEALVAHAAAIWDAPAVGNRLLLEETAGHARLHAAWVLLPPCTRELGTAPEFVAALRAAGVRAVFACPEPHQYLLNGLTLGPLLELLVECRVPVFLRRGDWKAVGELLRDFPDLVLIQAGMGSWGVQRFCWPLLEHYPHFYFEIANQQLAGGLETHVERFGPDRLLFGTHYPTCAMGGPRLNLLHADIPDAAKQAIAAGNLRRVLSEVAW